MSGAPGNRSSPPSPRTAPSSPAATRVPSSRPASSTRSWMSSAMRLLASLAGRWTISSRRLGERLHAVRRLVTPKGNYCARWRVSLRTEVRMKRAPFLAALVLASALFALTRDVQPALACSGPPTWQQMAHAHAIFEGRVTQARHLPEHDEFSYRVLEVVARVEVPHLNSVVGQEFVTHVRVPK